MNKRDFPKIHFYDQDFVDIYDKTWTWLLDFCIDPKTKEPSPEGYLLYSKKDELVITKYTYDVFVEGGYREEGKEIKIYRELFKCILAFVLFSSISKSILNGELCYKRKTQLGSNPKLC